MEHQVPANPAPRTTRLNGGNGPPWKVGLEDPEIEDRLAEWQQFYNWERSHHSLGGLDRVCGLLSLTLTGQEIAAAYKPDREFILPRDHWPPTRSVFR